jgi:hypothetical protein
MRIDALRAIPYSLRAAANSALAGDVVTFVPAVSEIMLTSPVGLSKAIALNGPGAEALTVDGGSGTQVFTVSADDVNIHGLTITHEQRRHRNRGRYELHVLRQSDERRYHANGRREQQRHRLLQELHVQRQRQRRYCNPAPSRVGFTTCSRICGDDRARGVGREEADQAPELSRRPSP